MNTSKVASGLAIVASSLLVACNITPEEETPINAGIAIVWNYNATTNKCYILHMVEQEENGQYDARLGGDVREALTKYVVWVGNGLEPSEAEGSEIRNSKTAARCGPELQGDLAGYEGFFKTSQPWDTVFRTLFRPKAESDACLTFNGVGETEAERAKSEPILKKNRACEASYMFIEGMKLSVIEKREGVHGDVWANVHREMVYDSKSTAMVNDMTAIRALIVKALQEGKPNDDKSKRYREHHEFSEAIFAE